MGLHDSELSIVMQDYRYLDSTMDGQPFKAGYHAATLRRMLWREHLGLLPAQELDASKDPNAQPPDVCPNDILEGPEYEFVADPLSDKVWDMWTGNATRNTDLFRHLFRADPDDNSKIFWQYLALHISGPAFIYITSHVQPFHLLIVFAIPLHTFLTLNLYAKFF